jgi:hypothetical protein
MEDQNIINLLGGFISAIIGWLLKTLWQAVGDLQKSDVELADKVNRIEVLVAGEYVKRDEFQGALDRLFIKLEQIEAKIDRKADK